MILMVVLIEVIEILLCYIIAYSTGGNIDDYIRLNVWLNSPSPDRILCDSKYLNMCYFQIPPLMKIIFMITAESWIGGKVKILLTLEIK